MRTGNEVNAKDFETLLAWLNHDSDTAARKYESIRARLISFFTCRGSCEPETLADETIDRVTAKIENLAHQFVGDQPELYFYGVARLVFHESLRQIKKTQSVMTEITAVAGSRRSTAQSVESLCLNGCLEQLPPEQGDLFLKYYEDDGAPKKERRRILMAELDISSEFLRVQIYRIKRTLKECIERCVKKKKIIVV